MSIRWIVTRQLYRYRRKSDVGQAPVDMGQWSGAKPTTARCAEHAERRQAVTHGTRVSVTIAAKIAATTPSTARGTMPIQYAGIGSSR